MAYAAHWVAMTGKKAVETRIKIYIILAQLLGLLWQQSALAAAVPDSDQILSGWVMLLGKRIPLPPGDWRIVSAGFGQVEGRDPGPYGTIGGVLLMRPSDWREREFLLIHTNALPVRDGWGEPAACTEPTALFQAAAEQRNQQNACSYVTVLRVGHLLRQRPPAIADPHVAKRDLPTWAIVTGFRVSDRSDMVDYLYGIAPRVPDPAGWFRDRDDLAPSYRAIVARLGGWSEKARHVVLAGLRDPPDQVPLIPPLPLTSHGAMGDPPPEGITALRLALYKLATIQIPESALTFALATSMSASPYIGALQTFWQGWTHSLLYVANDMAWEYPGATPTMEFTANGPPSNGLDMLRGVEAASPMALATRDMRAPLPSVAPSDESTDATVVADGPFMIAGKQAPLPFGTWRVIARRTDKTTIGTVLARVEDRSLIGLAVINTNPAKLEAIFGTSGDCRRDDLVLSVVRYDTPEDGYCSYQKTLVLDKEGDGYPLWQAAREKLEVDGIRLPSTVLMVGARARTRENFLDARYYFPTPPPDEEVVQAWADLLQRPLELGLRGRLPLGIAGLPWPWQTAAVADATIQRAYSPIEALAQSGAIDRAAALTRQLALADAAKSSEERQRWSLWTRAAYKTIIYRIVSIGDTLGVAYLVTGSMAQSVAYGSANQVIRPLLIYANEIFWAHSGNGKASATLLSVTFPEIGSEQR